VIKDLERLPGHIVMKLNAWRDAVEKQGLEEVRKVPGFHDEALKGDRKGQRSIRLSRGYRALYRMVQGEQSYVLVEEVNKHEY
jgi:proteic killer suppression protein